MKTLLKSVSQFETISKLWNEVLDDQSALPSRVFNAQYMSFRIAQYDWFASAGAWESLKQLLRNSGTRCLFIGSLDPHPIDYYFEHFQHLHLWSLDVDSTSADYWCALVADPGSSEADALRHRAEILVAVADNAEWAIYCDWSFECAIFATKTPELTTQLPPNWYRCEDFLSSELLVLPEDGRTILNSFSHSYRD